MDSLFIAETDEDGRVTFVWRKRSSDLYPKPIGKDRAECLTALPHAQVAGATRTEIQEWLAAH